MRGFYVLFFFLTAFIFSAQSAQKTTSPFTNLKDSASYKISKINIKLAHESIQKNQNLQKEFVTRSSIKFTPFNFIAILDAFQFPSNTLSYQLKKQFCFKNSLGSMFKLLYPKHFFR